MTDGFYALFERALEHSGERYLRLPFGREHEEMIKSDVADVKNVGGGCCGHHHGRAVYPQLL